MQFCFLAATAVFYAKKQIHNYRVRSGRAASTPLPCTHAAACPLLAPIQACALFCRWRADVPLVPGCRHDSGVLLPGIHLVRRHSECQREWVGLNL